MADEQPAEKKAEGATATAEAKEAKDPKKEAADKKAAEKKAAEENFEAPAGQRLYEAMWVVDVNVARESFTKVLDGIKELVEKSGGHWVNGDKWEERRLAYPIKKRKRAVYILSHFTSDPSNIVKMERQIRINDLVLRHLITKDDDGLTLTQKPRTNDDFGGPGGGRFR